MVTAVSACTEAARVTTTPPGARLYVNGEFVGITPTVYRVARSKWPEVFTYRFDLEGFHSREGELRTMLYRGRLVGSVFSLGILALLRRPVSLVDPQVFVLEPVATGNPPVPLLPRGDSPRRESTLEERLRRLRQARDEGRLSPAEYERQSDEILEDL